LDLVYINQMLSRESLYWGSCCYDRCFILGFMLSSVFPVSIWKETEKSSDFCGLSSAFCGGIFCSGIQGDEN
jgi:hypothetical protein